MTCRPSRADQKQPIALTAPYESQTAEIKRRRVTNGGTSNPCQVSAMHIAFYVDDLGAVLSGWRPLDDIGRGAAAPASVAGTSADGDGHRHAHVAIE